ncbi:MAG: hypothetical protein A3H96_09420 [Acidobacteria bacterium RIFCSPLOWO2_02_FULL_67_36]|nr:MAG: hypothetical protein A3H96_09420 [Acidobacteria bacterium RIFCSPLOWO2_02_FULL_67_36]OFW25008.1 MAG: hypothetical protein A3G21_16320 [Acidobacteria bacterium RIFCSPLOWO2_12_FULL_66_21]
MTTTTAGALADYDFIGAVGALIAAVEGFEQAAPEDRVAAYEAFLVTVRDLVATMDRMLPRGNLLDGPPLSLEEVLALRDVAEGIVVSCSTMRIRAERRIADLRWERENCAKMTGTPTM